MKRRMVCPGSDRLCDGIPDQSGVFAAEGTAQHMLVEACVEMGIKDASKMIGTTYNGFVMTAAHCDNVQICLDYIEGLTGYEIELEQNFDLSEVYPGWGGIGDLTAYNETTSHLVVADWKFGRGVAVEVLNNPQLLTYAVGVLYRYGNRRVKSVTATVVQPPAYHADGPIRSQTFSPVELMDWTADAIDALRLSDSPDAPLAVSEECRFCKASAICPEREKFVMSQAEAVFKGAPPVEAVRAYSDVELAARLAVVAQVEEWCKSVRDFAHHEAEAGRCPPGYKLVATRPMRKFKDVESAFSELCKAHAIEKSDLYSDPSPKSPAQVETALKAYGFKPKDAKALISPFTESVSSGTVLAPADDPRDPVRPPVATVFSVVE
jgi:hypothetical protein